MPRRASRLPAAVAPQPAADAFVAVPLSLLPPMSPERRQSVRDLYEMALAEARAVVAPPPSQRGLAGGLN